MLQLYLFKQLWKRTLKKNIHTSTRFEPVTSAQRFNQLIYKAREQLMVHQYLSELYNDYWDCMSFYRAVNNVLNDHRGYDYWDWVFAAA